MFKSKKDEQLPFMYFYDIQDKKDDEFEQISYSTRSSDPKRNWASSPVIESSSPPVIPPVNESTSVIPPITPPVTESPTPEIGPNSQISEE